MPLIEGKYISFTAIEKDVYEVLEVNPTHRREKLIGIISRNEQGWVINNDALDTGLQYSSRDKAAQGLVRTYLGKDVEEPEKGGEIYKPRVVEILGREVQIEKRQVGEGCNYYIYLLDGANPEKPIGYIFRSVTGKWASNVYKVAYEKKKQMIEALVRGYKAPVYKVKKKVKIKEKEEMASNLKPKIKLSSKKSTPVAEPAPVKKTVSNGASKKIRVKVPHELEMNEDGDLILTIHPNLRPSKSGRTMLIGSSMGSKSTGVYVEYEGEEYEVFGNFNYWIKPE